MAEPLRPGNEDEVLAALADALARRRPLEVIGQGSKRGWGHPVAAETELRLDRLDGILLHEPEELVLTARAGTPMATVEAVLCQHRQRLEFEPPDYGPLWGNASGRGTIGGAVAANLAGPRRLRAGAARDHTLGFRAASGRAELFKSGGRVVKNVTGFDLSKLMAGSHGTLAVLTEVTVKVLPAPDRERTLVLAGDDEVRAVAAMTRALGAPLEVSGAAHLPAELAAAIGAGGWHKAGGGATLFRLEGTAVSIAARAAELMALDHGAAWGQIDDAESRALWRAIRDVGPFVATGDAVWRISVPPAGGAEAAHRLRRATGGRAFLDWAGGLIWLAVPAGDDALAPAVRAALVDGGHATLLRAPVEVRARVPVFQPQPEPLAQLSRRIKAAFDPEGILNPGRMAAATGAA